MNPDPDTSRMQAARQAAARGTQVVGLAGSVVPVELVLAAGCPSISWNCSARGIAITGSTTTRSLT